VFEGGGVADQFGDWSHVRAAEYMGGFTELWVPDNLKSGVKKPNRYELDLNPTYADLPSTTARRSSLRG